MFSGVAVSSAPPELDPMHMFETLQLSLHNHLSLIGADNKNTSEPAINDYRKLKTQWGDSKMCT